METRHAERGSRFRRFFSSRSVLTPPLPPVSFQPYENNRVIRTKSTNGHNSKGLTSTDLCSEPHFKRPFAPDNRPFSPRKPLNPARVYGLPLAFTSSSTAGTTLSTSTACGFPAAFSTSRFFSFASALTVR